MKENPIAEYMANWLNIMAKHPGKTLKMTRDGLEALESDAPPYLIIESTVRNINNVEANYK